MSTLKLETLAIHSGYTPDATTSSAIPIHRTAAYVFNNTEHAANLFALKELGNIYTRITNPTTQALEERVTDIEGGAASVSFASGTAAIYNTIINLTSQGDEIISSKDIYGGTYTMLHDIFPSLGITTKFVDFSDLDNITQAITDKTKAVFFESIGNPVLKVFDFKKISDLAHSHGIPVIVDATFTTPHIIKTIEHGADIVINSLTKWLGGHGNAIGGVVTDAGTFQWADNPRFPNFNEPDESYHDIRWAHDIGPLIPVAFAIRLRVVPLRNVGSCLSPDNAWLFLHGIETFSLRVERHSENARKVADFLSQHPKISNVGYPGLSSDPSHEVSNKYFSHNLFGGMVIIDINGGKEQAEKFINSLELFSHLANVGDTKSLAIHPASTTHSQLSSEQLKVAGISENFVRLSIGIEHIDDIIADLDQALAKI